MMNLEKVCKVQLAVLGTGRPFIQLSEQVIEHAARSMRATTIPGGARPDAWPAHLARLDKIDPGYKGLWR